MTPSIMRLFWDLVNRSQPSHLLGMDDDGLVSWLVDQVQQNSSLDRQQQDALCNYINSRMPLIRDIAANH
ncbi:hypothetical protein Pse7367_2856 [Thalassoporum mexicanum PCC 7367]|uniref:hypothetical protein n=1 Tax=Thalassoporum mexicanum TaxID=3457544 RepID=UPI00029F9B84|nr:hypothetical protein [Pseudanabaena sp. PCC 7367]AFY71109.1 hypothetical protein Pse7367_2856 [Pseudanabaena sp. PCC 7367]